MEKSEEDKSLYKFIRIHSWALRRGKEWECLGTGTGENECDTVFLKVPGEKKRGILLPSHASGIQAIMTTHSKALKVQAILKSRSKNFHPIFEFDHTVNIGARKYPYITRRLATGKKYVYLDRGIKHCLQTVLEQDLWEIGFKGHNKYGFDLGSSNIIFASFDVEDYSDQMRRAGGDYTACKKILSKIYKAGGKIHIFDFGTWITPDGSDKNDNKE